MPEQWRTILRNGQWHITDGTQLIIVRHGYLAAMMLVDCMNENQAEVLYPDGLRFPISLAESEAGEMLISEPQLMEALRNVNDLENL